MDSTRNFENLLAKAAQKDGSLSAKSLKSHTSAKNPKKNRVHVDDVLRELEFEIKMQHAKEMSQPNSIDMLKNKISELQLKTEYMIRDKNSLESTN